MAVPGSRLHRAWRRGFVGVRAVAPAPLKEFYRYFVPRTMRESFRDIYLLDAWGDGSGKGSTPENTRPYREFLQAFMAQHDIRSVVDLGCGDWRFSRLIDWSGIDYLGIDAVPEVIANNQRMHGDRARFLCRDFSRGDLPPADLALVKDVLQHWPHDAIHALVERLRSYPYVLITNCSYENGHLNEQIGMGGFRPLDLTREPFDLELDEVLRFRTDGVPTRGDNKQVLLMRGTEMRASANADRPALSRVRARDRSRRTVAAPERRD
jgi:SAM-dependent methyltransferase